MLNKEIPKEQLKKLKLLMLDSDGVVVEKHVTKILEKEEGDDYRITFNSRQMTDGLAEKINKLKSKIKIGIASGRHMLTLKTVYNKVFDSEMLFLSENGNFVFMNGKNEQLKEYDSEYYELISKVREEARKLPITGFEPKEAFLTTHCPSELQSMYDLIERLDKNKILQMMWVGEEAFDILHKDMSKGVGMRLLMDRLDIKPDEVIAIGDGLNDVPMLEEAGIAVSANPEKIKMPYWTTGEGLPGEQLVDYLLENL